MNATLVVLAAGMGSRFGGLKQMEGVGPNGEVLAHYSIFDAHQAGFNKVVYIIKPEMKEDFCNLVADKINFIDYELAYQKMDDLPEGFAAVEREKPWGTSHAVWAARHIINEPFVVINADDYYGKNIYKSMYDFLKNNSDPFVYGLAGYRLADTITKHGSVSRGVCYAKDGFLSEIIERTHIIYKDDKIGYVENDNFSELEPETLVSMNAFAFKPSIFAEIEKGFAEFLKTNINEPKIEYFLPKTAQELINSQKAKFSIIPALDKWYGFTYKEEHKMVCDAIAEMIKKGDYPTRL